jgi:hypothetical protein
MFQPFIDTVSQFSIPGTQTFEWTGSASDVDQQAFTEAEMAFDPGGQITRNSLGLISQLRLPHRCDFRRPGFQRQCRLASWRCDLRKTQPS